MRIDTARLLRIVAHDPNLGDHIRLPIVGRVALRVIKLTNRINHRLAHGHMTQNGVLLIQMGLHTPNKRNIAIGTIDIAGNPRCIHRPALMSGLPRRDKLGIEGDAISRPRSEAALPAGVTRLGHKVWHDYKSTTQAAAKDETQATLCL